MTDLIDLILHQIRNEPNQELSIEWDGIEWCVLAVNLSDCVCIAEGRAKYQVFDDKLIPALETLTRKIQKELGE